MRRKSYFPRQDAARTNWSSTFETGIAVPANAAAMGWTSTDVTALINASKSIRTAIALVAAKEAEYKSAVAAKETTITAAIGIIGPYVKGGKTKTTYTEAVGQALGVIGDEGVVTDWSTFQPIITAVVRPGAVDIRFEKNGADGMNIYTRLKGQGAWVKLAFDLYSPYVDNRPGATPGQSENREYSAIAVVNDMEVGQRSDIISVIFAG